MKLSPLLAVLLEWVLLDPAFLRTGVLDLSDGFRLRQESESLPHSGLVGPESKRQRKVPEKSSTKYVLKGLRMSHRVWLKVWLRRKLRILDELRQ